MKKDINYFRTLDWEGLKRWAKYGTDSEVDWRDLAATLVERAEEKMAETKTTSDGYHHWDSN
jgi:hypothetical protein